MISEVLKSETKVLHDLVEEKFQSKKIFSGEFSLGDYKKFILSHYYLLQYSENALLEKLKDVDGLELEKRRKFPFIEKEISAFQLFPEERNNKLEVENQAEALGFLYVIEGSTLGGKVIQKQLSKNPEFQFVTFSYLNCYGDETGSFWKFFLAVLNREVKEADAHFCTKGAEKAYRFLIDLFH